MVYYLLLSAKILDSEYKDEKFQNLFSDFQKLVKEYKDQRIKEKHKLFFKKFIDILKEQDKESPDIFSDVRKQELEKKRHQIERIRDLIP